MIDEKVEKDNIAILTKVPILYADRPGRNLNVYEEEEIIKGLEFFNNASELDRTLRYVYIRHTNDEIGERENLQLVAGWIDRLYYDKQTKTLYADIKLLPTTWGKLVKWLIKHNYPVGTSIRGSGIPVEKIITWNNKEIKVEFRKNFKLKGFDFVVEPSFITTQIAGEHYIKEQTNKDNPNIKDEIINLIANEENLTEEEKCELDTFCSLSCNNSKDNTITEQTKNQDTEEFINNFNEGGIKMDNLEKERLELEIEKLSIRKTKIEDEIKALEEKIEQLKKELEQGETEKSEQVKELEKIKEEIKTLTLLKVETENEINSLKQELESLKSEIEKVNQEKVELEEAVKVLEQSMEEDKVIVRKFGKVFSEDNPPKVRIVSPEDRVLTTDWGKVKKDFLRKIAYLAYKGGNEEVKKAFGLLAEGWKEDWREWKYPVCQFVKSEDENYDFDCVLNLNGLKTAYIFMMGRPGMSLTYKEKKELAKNLLYWYKKAKEAGRIDEIPEALVKVAEGTFVLTEQDEIADIILETLQERGLLSIEIPEDVKEQSNETDNTISVNPEDILVNVSKAVADAILGKVYTYNEELEKVIEQVNEGNDNLNIEQEMQRFYQIVIENTGFENAEEVENYIKEAIISETASDLLLTLKPIVSIITSKLTEEGIEPEKAVNYAFNILSILATRFEDELTTEEGNEMETEDNAGKEEDTMKDMSANTVNEGIENNETLYEQSNNNNDDEDIKDEETNQETLNKEEELEMEKLKAIIALINDNYELDVEVNPDNIVDVLASIFNKHVKVEEQVENLTKQVEELQAKIEELVNIQKEEGNTKEKEVSKEEEEVKEQSRKGKIDIEEQSKGKSDEDMFIKLLRNI